MPNKFSDLPKNKAAMKEFLTLALWSQDWNAVALTLIAEFQASPSKEKALALVDRFATVAKNNEIETQLNTNRALYPENGAKNAHAKALDEAYMECQKGNKPVAKMFDALALALDHEMTTTQDLLAKFDFKKKATDPAYETRWKIYKSGAGKADADKTWKNWNLTYLPVLTKAGFSVKDMSVKI